MKTKKKLIDEEQRANERKLHKEFENTKRQVAFKPSPNYINEKVYEGSLYDLHVYVFQGKDESQDYPF